MAHVFRRDRVVLLGWSNGGSTVLATTRKSASLPAGLLRGAVAFYPGCRSFAASARWHPSTKLLILIGDAARPPRAGKERAYTAAGISPAHAGTNPAAREDDLTRVPAFIDGLR
jgi:dienelactone hydrolase